MAYLDNEAFGADKGEEDDAYDGFGDRDDEESEDVEDDLARPASEPGRGGSNKYTFRKVSQIVFSQGFASAKCMCFRKLSQICFRSNTNVSQAFANMISQAFASFRANSQIWFRSVSQAFAIHGFASFRNDSQMDFRNHSPRICKCENHGFSQGFAMGTLLMLLSYVPPQVNDSVLTSCQACNGTLVQLRCWMSCIII